jgi:hydroxymethylpyrimidine/phosphomethylpyrimidine kinase
MIRPATQRETSPGTVAARKRAVPVALTIAGSDSSGGAGLQADLKTFTALGIYGASAVTCVVAEHPGRVLNLTPLPPARVADQVRLVLEAFPVAAIKTGMLYSAETIAAVARVIKPALKAGVPLIIDPVMTASAGGRLLQPDALRALHRLMAQATLVTPNRDELAVLTGLRIENPAQLNQAARKLAEELAGPAILAKGGHLDGREAIDVLVSPGGKTRLYRARRIPGVDPHGTGCTYSAAITAGVARGLSLPSAVALGKRFIDRALRHRLQLGRYQLLNHLER